MLCLLPALLLTLLVEPGLHLFEHLRGVADNQLDRPVGSFEEFDGLLVRLSLHGLERNKDHGEESFGTHLGLRLRFL